MTATASSTYRIQLRGDTFTFADAAGIVDHLDDLGVSHLYLSPILTATTGSTHGYDVVDPGSVSESLGGRAGFEALVAAARSRGMGVVVDIVPNHVGVANPRENHWWWDVLKNGASSEYARFFDLDLSPDNGVGGRIALPVLGSGDGDDALTLDHSGSDVLLAYYDDRYPVAPGTGSGSPAEVHARQAYRLVPWDSGLIGYRRFFTVTELAGVRVEDPEVFDAVHREVASWIADGLVDGLRVDHPDGLADPTGYLHRLRSLLGPNRWLVIEKILGEDEPLDATLPVDGTTGYDALNELSAVFVDPGGAETLGALSHRLTGARGDATWLHEQERRLAREVLESSLAPEVRRLVRAVRRESAATAGHDEIRRAVIAVVERVPVYRTDYAPLASVLPRIVGELALEEPDLAPALEDLVRAATVGTETAARFGQVCGAATAKSVEDCLFYRAARLISLQEVGGAPGRFALTPAEFHLRWGRRARSWPRAMTTLSTHDTKRGEDVRARIGVLSQVAEQWTERVLRWEETTPSPDPAIGAFLWQTLFGVWRSDGEVSGDLRGRLHEYARKAVRENGTRTTWTRVDDAFEGAVSRWIDEVCDGPAGTELAAFVSDLAPHIRANCLGQKLLHLLGPGIPDVYQGTELDDDSLVDPDNRRPVDFTVRRALSRAADVPEKFAVTRAALRLRRERPASFVGGEYVPLRARGPAAAHVLAFGRGPTAAEVDVVAVASRSTVSVASSGWDATVLTLPEGTWTDVLSGRSFGGTVRVDDLVVDLPVAALRRDR